MINEVTRERTEQTKRETSDRTPKGQQKKKRPPGQVQDAGNGNGQGRAKSRGKSKKGSTSFPLSKPSQRVSMRVPLPTAEPGRRGTLVGDDAAAELLQKFEPADQERYELYANLHGYEAAIEQMQRDLEAPPTRPDSGASPSTESASLSSRSRESGRWHFRSRTSCSSGMCIRKEEGQGGEDSH